MSQEWQMTTRDLGISRRLTGVGALVISAVVLAVYFPALQLGFHVDDWRYLELVGRLGPLQFVGRSFNPLEPSFLYTYRPLQGLLLGLEYPFFGRDPAGYHWIQLIFHLANCLLVYSIFRTLAQTWRVGALAGLVFASLPILGVTIFLPATQDVLATLFFLAAIQLWLAFLSTKGMRFFFLTHVILVLGLLTKESVATLPITLLMIDYFFVGSTQQITTLIRRYVWMAIILLPYVIFEISIQPKTLGSLYGFGFGPHILTNAAGYLPALVFPWNVDIPYVGLLALIVVGISFLYAVRARSVLLAFLAAWSLMNTLPVLGLQFKFSLRFLYLSVIGSAVFLALVVNASNRVFSRWRFSITLASGFAVGLVLFSANGVAVAAREYTQATFEERWLFRDISQQHPTFPDDTYLYFLGTGDSYLPHLSGMFFWKYGDRLTVGGWNPLGKSHLAEHANSLIYYMNSSGNPVEIRFQKDSVTTGSPKLPVTFDGAIQLTGYQVSSSSISRGGDIAVFLYWQSLKKVDRDYTVFVHLVRGGDVLAGVDSQPVGGKIPTTIWKVDDQIMDAIVLSVPSDVPARNDYHLEIGLYYLPTLERLSLVDENGARSADYVDIYPFDVR